MGKSGKKPKPADDPDDRPTDRVQPTISTTGIKNTHNVSVSVANPSTSSAKSNTNSRPTQRSNDRTWKPNYRLDYLMSYNHGESDTMSCMVCGIVNASNLKRTPARNTYLENIPRLKDIARPANRPLHWSLRETWWNRKINSMSTWHQWNSVRWPRINKLILYATTNIHSPLQSQGSTNPVPGRLGLPVWCAGPPPFICLKLAGPPVFKRRCMCSYTDHCMDNLQ